MTTIMASSASRQGDSKSINQDVLSRIQRLNVTGRITDMSQKAVAYGGYSEVFTGSLRTGEKMNGQVDVAVKRLRFHTGEEKVLEARPPLLIAEDLAGSHDVSSNSPRKSTYGQSCPIRTSCRYLATPSARKQTFPCSFPNGCISVLLGRMC